MINATGAKIDGLRSILSFEFIPDLRLIAGPISILVAAEENTAVRMMIGVSRMGANVKLKNEVLVGGRGFQLAGSALHVDQALSHGPLWRASAKIGTIHLLPAA